MSLTWQKLYRRRPPIECHLLHNETSKASRGEIRLFTEILTPDEASQFSAADITPSPELEFEVRLVLWKTKDVPSGDFLNESDMWFRASMPGMDAQQTDVHWRAYNGVGSFNFRMIFKCCIPLAPEYAKIHLQSYDADPLSPWKPRDLLGEAEIDLVSEMRQAYVREINRRKALQREVQLETANELRAFKSCLGSAGDSSETNLFVHEYRIDDDDVIPKGATFVRLARKTAPTIAHIKLKDTGTLQKEGVERIRPDPASLLRKHMRDVPIIRNLIQETSVDELVKNNAARWIPLFKLRHGENMTRAAAGSVAISLDIVSISLAELDPVGLGRNEPNCKPFLPEPEGRIRMSSWYNPYNMCFDLCGPKVARAVCACSMCLVCMFLILAIGCISFSLHEIMWIF